MWLRGSFIQPPLLRRGGQKMEIFFVWIKPPTECTTGVGTVDENKCQITFKRPRKREEASVLSTRSRQNRLRLQVPPSQPKGLAGRAPLSGFSIKKKSAHYAADKKPMYCSDASADIRMAVVAHCLASSTGDYNFHSPTETNASIAGSHFWLYVLQLPRAGQATHTPAYFCWTRTLPIVGKHVLQLCTPCHSYIYEARGTLYTSTMTL